MSYNIKTISTFEKQASRLSRKYNSLKSELIELVKSLKENPLQGDIIGKNCYKIRLTIESKGKGKSGGARIITNIHICNETVYLLSIYDKSDKDNLSENELIKLLSEIPD